MLLTGALFKSTQPDETDQERRELERYDLIFDFCLHWLLMMIRNRMVHEAAQPKTKQTATKAAKARREEMVKRAEAETAAKEKTSPPSTTAVPAKATTAPA